MGEHVIETHEQVQSSRAYRHIRNTTLRTYDIFNSHTTLIYDTQYSNASDSHQLSCLIHTAANLPNVQSM